MQVSSVLFRNHIVKNYPEFFYKKFPHQDWSLYLLLAEHGKIKRIPGYMAVYRSHSGGMFNSLPDMKKYEKMHKMRKTLNKYFNGKYKNYFFNNQSWPTKDLVLSCYWEEFLNSYQAGKFINASGYAFKLIGLLGFSSKNPFRITRIGIVKRLMLTLFVPKKDELLI
jgi:hypothetical protein